MQRAQGEELRYETSDKREVARSREVVEVRGTVKRCTGGRVSGKLKSHFIPWAFYMEEGYVKHASSRMGTVSVKIPRIETSYYEKAAFQETKSILGLLRMNCNVERVGTFRAGIRAHELRAALSAIGSDRGN